jgi:hypothetical protein|tara:strand:+ start:303 stop:518 length:216 start_codon:yes stop_codon:yes gene_type:complete
MANKFGPYIQRLMTTILDKEQDEFVQDLAWKELKRVNSDIEEFLREKSNDDSEKVEQTKQLLQEDDKDGDN